MDITPIQKRFKIYTRTCTVAEMLIGLPLDDEFRGIVLTHYPSSDTDTDTTEIFEITRNELISEMIEIYGEWSIVYNSTDSPEHVNNYHNPGEPRKVFLRMWGDYVKYNKDNWRRIATAYAAKYDPISNYDRHEEIHYTDELTKSGSITDRDDSYNYATNSGTVTDVYGKAMDVSITSREPTRKEDGSLDGGAATTVSVIPDFVPDGVTTTESATTYDSTTEAETSQSNVKGIQQSIPETVDYGKTLSDHTQTFSAYKETTKHDTGDNGSRIYGNIGVTTSATMVKEIRDVYQLDMLHYIIDGFAKKYLVLLPVDEELERSDGCGCYFL